MAGTIFHPVRVIVAAAEAVLRDVLETALGAAGYPVDALVSSVPELRDRLDELDAGRGGAALVVTGPGWEPAKRFVRAALAQGAPVAIWPSVPAHHRPNRQTQTPARMPAPGKDRLTEREREILALVASGISNKGIARRLHVSPNTVKFHVAGALAKLGASTRAEAVAAAARRGEIAL